MYKMIMTEPVLIRSLFRTSLSFPISLQFVQCEQNAVDDRLRPGWTAGNGHGNRQKLVDPAEVSVAFTENAAVNGTISNRQHHLGIGSGLPCLYYGLGQIARDASCGDQHVGMSWRSDEIDAEPLDIVNRIEQSGEFPVAAVA